MEYFYYSKINILHQKGDFLMCLTSYVLIHKQLVNGLTVIMVCNDKFNHHSLKIKNVISNSKYGYPNHFKMTWKFGGLLGTPKQKENIHNNINFVKLLKLFSQTFYFEMYLNTYTFIYFFNQMLHP
jgi:hypothetical protein